MGKSMITQTLLSARTAAGVSSSFIVTNDSPHTVKVNGLAGAETATLQGTSDGITFYDLSDADGTIQLTASQNSMLVEGPGEYKVSKSATVGSVAVVVSG